MEINRNLNSLKEFRRSRVASLLDEHGKVGLSTLVDISADYLWQMGKGVGKSARGVSDMNAAKMEAALGKPAGWMDGEPQDRAQQDDSQPMRLDPEIVAKVARALRDTYAPEGLVYSLADEYGLFIELYEDAINGRLGSASSNVKIGRWIERKTPQGAEQHGRRDGVPATGTDKRTKRVRRKS